MSQSHATRNFIAEACKAIRLSGGSAIKPKVYVLPSSTPPPPELDSDKDNDNNDHHEDKEEAQEGSEGEEEGEEFAVKIENSYTLDYAGSDVDLEDEFQADVNSESESGEAAPLLETGSREQYFEDSAKELSNNEMEEDASPQLFYMDEDNDTVTSSHYNTSKPTYQPKKKKKLKNLRPFRPPPPTSNQCPRCGKVLCNTYYVAKHLEKSCCKRKVGRPKKNSQHKEVTPEPNGDSGRTEIESREEPAHNPKAVNFIEESVSKTDSRRKGVKSREESKYKPGRKGESDRVRKYKCSKCPKVLSSESNWRRHEASKHIRRGFDSLDERVYKCWGEGCTKTFHKSGALSTHQRLYCHALKVQHIVNEKIQPGVCPACGKFLFSRKSLLVHQVLMCKVAVPQEELDKYSITFQSCDQCDLRFWKPCDLKRHQLIHDRANNMLHSMEDSVEEEGDGDGDLQEEQVMGEFIFGFEIENS